MINIIHNWINGEEYKSSNSTYIRKFNPHNGEIISEFINSDITCLERAIKYASLGFEIWSSYNPVKRGKILDNYIQLIIENKEKLCELISKETGKSIKNSELELSACISLCRFYSGEGMRLYSNSLTSGVDCKFSHTTRCPIGVAALIVPANTPLANIIWKLFPALICGNSVIIKSSEDAPELAFFLAKISKSSDLPDGVINVLHGLGSEIGQKIIESNQIQLISFTGSTKIGKHIAEVCGKNLTRISLELGGKNPIVICNDANLEQAVKWTLLSSFSNAGQRCASSSRIIVESDIYEIFINKLIDETNKLKLGINDDDDLGPVINKKQEKHILNNIEKAIENRGKLLCGGTKNTQNYKGYYINPTLIEIEDNDSEILQNEIFGPVATIQKVKNTREALNLANDSIYGLTAAIHTINIDKAMWFAQKIKAGVVNINIGTYGSEPHMPFGGFRHSGNGTREPGTEAINFYSELKNISYLVREENV